jgi:hypothetical protein
MTETPDETQTPDTVPPPEWTTPNEEEQAEQEEAEQTPAEAADLSRPRATDLPLEGSRSRARRLYRVCRPGLAEQADARA